MQENLKANQLIAPFGFLEVPQCGELALQTRRQFLAISILLLISPSIILEKQVGIQGNH